MDAKKRLPKRAATVLKVKAAVATFVTTVVIYGDHTHQGYN